MQVAFTGLPVAEYEPAREWYERLFGRAPEMLPREGEAVWQLTEAGWVYVVEDGERAGRGLLTVIVGDLDVVVSELGGRDIEVEFPDLADGAVRRVVVHDPDGNRITFAQV